jgi:predicted Zn-dependent protease with MMP-like domain
MDDIDIEPFIDEALNDLPEHFHRQIDNVVIMVEDWPDWRTVRLAGVRSPQDLLGFYHGIPLTQRTSNYVLTVPDQISIYRRVILRHCQTIDEVRDMVKHTVFHELAHYFGISDDRLRELGAY